MELPLVAAFYGFITQKHEQQSKQFKRYVTTQVHLFGLTNQATWAKSLTSGTKINSHGIFVYLFR